MVHYLQQGCNAASPTRLVRFRGGLHGWHFTHVAAAGGQVQRMAAESNFGDNTGIEGKRLIVKCL